MESDRGPLIKLHLNVIIGFWSFLVYVGVFVTSFIRPDFFGSALPFIRIGFTFLIIIAAGIEGAEVKVFRNRYTFFKSLQVENTYTLGIRSTFFNLEAFRNKVRELESKPSLKNKECYVLSFAPTRTNTVGANINRDLQILNQGLASFINRIMVTKENGDFSRRNAVYAFDRNNFLFYLFANNESEIHKLIAQISNECFRLVNDEEKKIQIWVQPFYGVCKKTEKNKSLTALIEKAIIAKTQGEKNIESVTFYKEAFNDIVSNEADEIKKGIENHEFIPYYQPKISLKDKKIVSCEVLARWKTPEGILPPAKFMKRAEDALLLNKIDLEIFDAAMKDLGDSLKRGRRAIPVSVNFSLYEFFSSNLIDNIVATLEKYNVKPNLLEIEITETASKTNKFLSFQAIKKLKDLGITILMDDFGTGFSQIDTLNDFPFDGIKIDKQFTSKLANSEKARSIVKFLVQLIHDNDMEAIVEGVETKEQVEILRKMKVDTVQGFYFSKPLPFEEYQKLLKENVFEKKGAKKWFLL